MNTPLKASNIRIAQRERPESLMEMKDKYKLNPQNNEVLPLRKRYRSREMYTNKCNAAASPPSKTNDSIMFLVVAVAVLGLMYMNRRKITKMVKMK